MTECVGGSVFDSLANSSEKEKNKKIKNKKNKENDSHDLRVNRSVGAAKNISY